MGKTITCFSRILTVPTIRKSKPRPLRQGTSISLRWRTTRCAAARILHSIGRYTITQGVEKDFAAYLRQGALGVADADPAPGGTTSNPRPVITAVLGYSGNLDPNSIETSVRDFGVVKHDYDPKTSTIRLYLPRDLIQPVNLVNIRVKDAQTGQIMVANWHLVMSSRWPALSPIRPSPRPPISRPPQ